MHRFVGFAFGWIPIMMILLTMMEMLTMCVYSNLPDMHHWHLEDHSSLLCLALSIPETELKNQPPRYLIMIIMMVMVMYVMINDYYYHGYVALSTELKN